MTAYISKNIEQRNTMIEQLMITNFSSVNSKHDNLLTATTM